MAFSRRDFLKVAWIPFAIAACGGADEVLGLATSTPTDIPTARPDNTPYVEPVAPTAMQVDVSYKVGMAVTPDSEPARAGIPVNSTLAQRYNKWVTVGIDGMVNGSVDRDGRWVTLKDIVRNVPTCVEKAVENGFQIADPINDPDSFTRDMNDYLNVVHQIEADYTGPIITPGTHKIGVGTDRIMFYDGTPIQPIASAFFNHNGLTYVVITLPAQDSQGRFGLNLVLNAQNPDRGDSRSRATPDQLLASMPGIVGGPSSEMMVAWAPLEDKNLITYYDNEFLRESVALLGSDYGQTFWDWSIGGKPFNRELEKDLLPVIDWYNNG